MEQELGISLWQEKEKEMQKEDFEIIFSKKSWKEWTLTICTAAIIASTYAIDPDFSPLAFFSFVGGAVWMNLIFMFLSLRIEKERREEDIYLAKHVDDLEEELRVVNDILKTK